MDEGGEAQRSQALTITADSVANRSSTGHRGDAGQLGDDCGCALLLCTSPEAQAAILCPAQAVGFTWSTTHTEER